MDERTTTKPADRDSRAGDAPPRDVEPGDRPPDRPTRLDHLPSDRYASRPTAATGAGRFGPAGRGLAVATGGAAIISLLGGPLSITGGLLAVAVIVGLALGAILRPATVVAVGLAVGSVIVGLLGVWLFARAEGGVLDPLAYFSDVQGALAPLQVVFAAVSAVVSSR